MQALISCDSGLLALVKRLRKYTLSPQKRMTSVRSQAARDGTQDGYPYRAMVRHEKIAPSGRFALSFASFSLWKTRPFRVDDLPIANARSH